VPYYRLYHLNRRSGHIDHVQEIEAADDVAAVAMSRALQRESAAELWQGDREVHRLDGLPDISVSYAS